MKRILRNESGQGMTEYMVLLLLIGISAIALTNTLGGKIRTSLSQANNAYDSTVKVYVDPPHGK